MTTLFRNFAMAGAIILVMQSSMVKGQTGLLTPPAVPADLQVEAGNTLFLKGEARGTQNYICLPSGSGVAWTFFSPQATLFVSLRLFGHEISQQIITHFLSPNPDEGGMPRATWQSSVDTSGVWAKVRQPSTDPKFVAAGAIPWLLLEKVGAQPGPTGGEILSRTTFIQRVNTSGGIAPATGCTTSANVGATALVPYKANYYFYKSSQRN